jgi:hypothetical protein
MSKFMIGCDPEVFVGDDVQARSVIDKIGGSKEFPRPLPIADGFSVQEDNVALEFNIPASPDKESFTQNMAAATGFLEQMVKDAYGYHFLKASAISFPESELSDPRAHIFGCEPDYNVWTRKRNPRPRTKDKNLRSAGGHVHVGFEFKDEDQKTIFGRHCDLFLSVPAALMDHAGRERKKLYGKAGAVRYKAYGMEYRPLSNFWIFDKRLQEWVYDNVGRALDATLSGEFGDLEQERDNILRAVDGDDLDMAQFLVKKYNLEVVHAA